MNFDATRIIRPGILAVQALLLILGGYFLVKAIIYFTTPESVWVAPPAVQAQQAAPLTPRITLPNGFDPFSRESVAQVPVNRGESAPETTLSLTLVARRFGTDATATIRTPDGQQKLVREGDEIMSGVVLDSVHEDYVLIKQGGRLERLSFEKDPTGLRTEPEEIASKVTVSGAGPSVAERVTIKQGEGDNLTIETDFPLSVAAGLLSFNEVRKDGRRQGYTIQSKNGAFDLTEMGLRPDDVITRINEEDLTIGNPEMNEILADSVRLNLLDFDILRDGRTVTISVKGP